jgi:hypothetical protein
MNEVEVSCRVFRPQSVNSDLEPTQLMAGTVGVTCRCAAVNEWAHCLTSRGVTTLLKPFSLPLRSNSLQCASAQIGSVHTELQQP